MVESGVIEPAAIARPAIRTYRRSAFQVALLMFASLGLYVFVWSYQIRRSVETLIEQPDQPIWKSVALIVPIFNFFLLFDLGKKIQGVQWRADPHRVNGALPWIGLSLFVLGVLGRLHSPVSTLGVFAFVPISVMQQELSRAQIALVGEDGTPTRLNWIEWIVIVVGCGFWALALFGAVTAPPEPSFPPVTRAWLIGSVVAAVAVLGVFAFTSRNAIAKGRAMYADPSPDRIAPGAG